MYYMRLHRCGSIFSYVLSMQLNAFLIALCSLMVYTLFVTRWRFLLKSCPRLISVTLTGTREKKWRERGKKSFRQIFTRQPADRREFIEYWRFQGFAYKDVKQALQNYSKRQFQSINDLAAAFFHTHIYSLHCYLLLSYTNIMLECLSQPLWFSNWIIHRLYEKYNNPEKKILGW